MVSDMAKMFRQILVHEEDTDLQRIIWRLDSDLPLSHFKLTTYGISAAPFLAMRVLQQLCEDDGNDYPLGVSVLQNSLCVDDVLFGAHDASTIQAIHRQLVALLELGKFHLRKWMSNYDELLQEIPVSDRLDISDIIFQDDSAVKALGLSWNSRLDVLSFQLQLPETSVFTKRSVLSLISRIFDPIGYCSGCDLCKNFYAGIVATQT